MTDPKQNISEAVGAVGIFGVLAVLWDYFDRNPSRYETYPVIQQELQRFDAELRLRLDEIDDPIDAELSRQEELERFQEHDVTPLSERQ